MPNQSFLRRHISSQGTRPLMLDMKRAVGLLVSRPASGHEAIKPKIQRGSELTFC